jgi:hypothetical protein
LGRPLTLSSPSPEQKEVLRQLSPLLPPDAYLAGGVAIAARLHHRTSRDLDWFVSGTDPLMLVDALSTAGAKIVSRAEGTLYVELAGIPASIIRYEYALLEPLEPLLGVRAASLEDLACMKLSAIASRGKARDFWDLHEILARTAKTLPGLLDAYQRKYVRHDVGHVVRSLVYFADAEADPMPEGLEEASWEGIKRDLERRVVAL